MPVAISRTTAPKTPEPYSPSAGFVLRELWSLRVTDWAPTCKVGHVESCGPKRTQAGAGTRARTVVSESRPVWRSMRKTTSESES